MYNYSTETLTDHCTVTRTNLKNNMSYETEFVVGSWFVEGLPRVLSIFDDILVYGEGETEEEAMRGHDVKIGSL